MSLACDSSPDPGLQFPVSTGLEVAGSTQSLVLVWSPPPQVAEQDPQMDHDPQPLRNGGKYFRIHHLQLRRQMLN